MNKCLKKIIRKKLWVMVLLFSKSVVSAQNWDLGGCSDTLPDVQPNFQRVECLILGGFSMRIDLGYNRIMMNRYRNELMLDDNSAMFGFAFGLGQFSLGARLNPYAQHLDNSILIGENYYTDQHRFQLFFGEVYLAYSINLPWNFSIDPHLGYSGASPTIWLDGERLKDTGLSSAQSLTGGIKLNKYIALFKPHTYMSIFVAGNANFHDLTAINPSFGRFHLDFSIGVSFKVRMYEKLIYIFPK